MSINRHDWTIIGVLVAFCVAIALIYNAGKDAGKRSVDAEHYRVVRDTIVMQTRVIEEKYRVDTVRVRVAEQKAVAARVSFDSAAARVEAVADTAKMVPSSLVLPEIQLCKELRDAQLEQIDGLKVAVRDLDEDVTLQKRRADLAEAQLKKARPRFGFRSGLIAGAALAVTVVHLVR